MTTQLYFAPGACSFVPHVMLEQAGAAFEPVMVKLHKGEQQSPEFLALNPNGQVPVLVEDGQAITQIAAICSYLNERFPQAGFLPSAPLEKAKAMETLMWFNNTVHPTFTHFFMPGKFTEEETAHPHLKQSAVKQYRKLLARIEELVRKKPTPWLAGNNLGPLDAYVLTLLRWGSIAGINPEDFPATWAHAQALAKEPAVARVIERERLQLNLFKG